MKLTKQQNQLSKLLLDLLITNGFGSGNGTVITVGGFAGTGKTTLICEFRKRLAKYSKNLPVAFVTYTGKASSVLNNKLRLENALFSSDHCGTIHSLIYELEHKWDKKLKTFVITGWKRKDIDSIYESVIIIDESSMVSKTMLDDLKSYNVPIIAFGDHGQLPPIGDNGFNIMMNPEYVLTEIHRQAENSPIIKLSKFAREEGYIPFGQYSPEVFKLSWRHPLAKKIWDKRVDFRDENLSILCGFNKTRAKLNDQIRKSLSFNHKQPYPGEKIVCLVNNHSTKIMNGQIGTVMFVMPDEDAYRITVNIDGEVYECFSSDRCFGEDVYTMYDRSGQLDESNALAKKKGFHQQDFFDYGYVTSVHKSQGSEWDKVILFEQRTPMWDDEYYAKWLYTAITRSREKLFVISDAWI